MILCFDPGSARTGFAMAEYLPERRKLDLKICTVISGTEVYDTLGLAEGLLLPEQKHEFIIENFRVDSAARGMMFQWNEMETSQLIGALKYAAFRMNGSPVTMQEPGVVLSQAKRWAPFKWPKGHLRDDLSAYCHLAFWAMRNNKIDTTDDILQKGQEMLW